MSLSWACIPRTRPKHSEIQIVPELTRGQKWRCDRLKARRESVMGGVAKLKEVRLSFFKTSLSVDNGAESKSLVLTLASSGANARA